MAEERREQYRLQIDLPVLYKVSDHPAIHKAVTYDISDSGIALYTYASYKKGTKLHVTLQGIFDSPKACAVVYSSQKYGVLHKIGARFLE